MIPENVSKKVNVIIGDIAKATAIDQDLYRDNSRLYICEDDVQNLFADLLASNRMIERIVLCPDEVNRQDTIEFITGFVKQNDVQLHLAVSPDDLDKYAPFTKHIDTPKEHFHRGYSNGNVS